MEKPKRIKQKEWLTPLVSQICYILALLPVLPDKSQI
jgi:hypothetical protein